MTIRILLKTTIPRIKDDWHIGRFSLLTAYLKGLTDQNGISLYNVSARDRIETPTGDDADLEAIARMAYDQLWLFGVDNTGALTDRDVRNIALFQAQGGGIFLTRDHQDLGACLSRLGTLGLTQHFQSANPESEAARRRCDDTENPAITWPNYHSGANGDLQSVEAVLPVHPLVQNRSGGVIVRLPAHPHEGVVGVPPGLGDVARVVITGRSKISGASFNLCVAVQQPGSGRCVSDSSFHHLADYNWDPRLGCPTFVTEPQGRQVLAVPNALDDVHDYVRNIASWLAGGI